MKRMMHARAVSAVYKAIILSLALLLPSCASAPKNTWEVSPGGQLYVLHQDPHVWPCLYRGPAAGCYAYEQGTHHVFVTSVYPWHTRRHEEGHVDGMRHVEWDWDGCTEVVQADFTGRYEVGDKLCIRSMGEQIIKKAK